MEVFPPRDTQMRNCPINVLIPQSNFFCWTLACIPSWPFVRTGSLSLLGLDWNGWASNLNFVITSQKASLYQAILKICGHNLLCRTLLWGKCDVASPVPPGLFDRRCVCVDDKQAGGGQQSATVDVRGGTIAVIGLIDPLARLPPKNKDDAPRSPTPGDWAAGGTITSKIFGRFSA